jgi:L-ribulose-5-phosphate 3-epimerase
VTEIHVMQGRLLPPVGDRIQAFPADGWERELSLARDAGVSGVEWIYEVAGEERNPLANEIGTLRAACASSGVAVESLVADWFMDRPLLEDPAARVEKLAWLCARATEAGIRRIVVPFVDASELRGPGDADALVAALDGFDSSGVEIHLETSLGPREFAALLSRLPDPPFKANYDTGNSASLGYDPNEELAAYGERIGSVHVKDRVRGGGTVALGDGDTDLPRVFALLRSLGFSRPLVLQVARGEPGREVEKTAADAARVRELWEAAA